MFTTTIDWLSFTMKGDVQNVNTMLSFLNPSGIMEPTKPKFGYGRASRLPNGVDMLSSGDGSSMGTHFIVPGSALRALLDEGTGGMAVLDKAISLGCKVTRLDIAKDAFEEQVGFIQLSEAAQTANFTGTAQKASVVSSSDGGMTVYIGSRQSERFVRVYDKGIESGQGGNWKRMELETKGDTANLLAHAIINDGASLNVLISTSVRKMCMIDNDDWKRFLNAEAEYSLPKVEKRTDREKWIEEQVASAVIAHIDEHPDSPAVRRLFEMLKERYN